MSFEPLDFEPIKNDERSVLSTDTELAILKLFDTAINSSSSSDIDEKAKRFVTNLVAFASEKKSGIDQDDDAVSATWEVLINAASCIPYRHYGQDILVKIVSLLGAAGDQWKDYPGFGIAMRENWNRNEWLSVNSSFVRLGDRSLSFGLWELRDGLECVKAERKPAPEAVIDTRILVATEWIIHGGRVLLRESLLNGLSSERTSGNPLGAGPLFAGARGFNFERWGFWKSRFGELRKTAVESWQKPIDEAVEKMTALEVELLMPGV